MSNSAIIYLVIICLVLAAALAAIMAVRASKAKKMADQAEQAAESKPQEPLRPAEYDSGSDAPESDRVLVPEIDEDFYDEKTVASYGFEDEKTVAIIDDYDGYEDKTLPLIVNEPEHKITFTSCADEHKVVCTGDSFTIGKSVMQCDYTISENKKISRVHAAFEFRDGKYYVTDSSTNGTKVNGTVLDKDESVPLNDGDIITFADEEFICKID